MKFLLISKCLQGRTDKSSTNKMDNFFKTHASVQQAQHRPTLHVDILIMTWV